jgi:hypothetical protein
MSSSTAPSNSRKICWRLLPTMLASTLSRPRWGMPMTEPSSPSSAAAESTASSMGMADSAPSMPKRLAPTYLVARNRSNASAALSRSRMWRCSSASGTTLTPSTCSWIQRFCSGSWMCMYSTPMVRQ